MIQALIRIDTRNRGSSPSLAYANLSLTFIYPKYEYANKR